MSFIEDRAASLDAVYGYYGVPAFYTPSGGAPLGVTALPDDAGAAASGGGGLDVRPGPSPANTVRLRTSELAALGLMATDPVARSTAPTWSGARITLPDGAARQIADKPRPANARRDEWIFDLA